MQATESYIRSLAWFLPWFRFRESELISESLNAALNVTALYQSSVGRRESNSPQIGLSALLESDHARYTFGWFSSSAKYRRAAHLLEVIKCLQLLSEMLLRRKYTHRQVWRWIICVESLKAFLRLIILRATRRPVVEPSLPDRDSDHPSSVETKPRPIIAQNANPHTPDHIKNNHGFFPPSPISAPNPMLSTTRPISIDEYLLTKALTPSSACPPTNLLVSLTTPKEWLSEILHIIRPFVYVLALARSGHRRTDFRPLLLSLSLDLLSVYLRRQPSSALPLERHEYARRDRELLWYLLRGPVWFKHTRPSILNLAARSEAVPIVGMFIALVREWIPLIDGYHYYTS
ncbi:peroxisome membrane protein [Clavulina sp. PMI_390]|nr:peroxisome membrane protein [Clavulina sp. PMI_390]